MNKTLFYSINFTNGKPNYHFIYLLQLQQQHEAKELLEIKTIKDYKKDKNIYDQSYNNNKKQ